MIAAVLLVGAAAPAGAQAAGQPEEVPQSDNERPFRLFLKQLYSGRFAEADATAKRLADPGHKEGRAMLQAMRGAAQLGLKRDKQAAKHFAEAQRLAPMDPHPTALQFDAAMMAGNMAVAADALDRLIARFPDVARRADWYFVRRFLQQEPAGQQQRNDDRKVALARLGFGGPVRGDFFAEQAIGILIDRGDIAGARELLPNIDEPRAIQNLLAQKRFSALWPDIEKLAGPQLAIVRGSSVASAERAVAENPGDLEALQTLVSALHDAGRLADAIEYRSKIPSSDAALAVADEQMGWLVNNVAFALHASGRVDEADQLFARLNKAAIGSTWIVNMTINRLGRLAADGQFEKARALLGLTESSALTGGTPYAQQVVRQLQFCTLSRLGRTDEAARILPALRRHADDAAAQTIAGLLCAGQLDQAEAVALEALKKPKFHPDFVRNLQAVALSNDQPPVWADQWQRLRARPAIAAEFDRLGRDLPEQLRVPKPAALSR
ncbi:hypothetical protein [Sphingomonas sp.]|uniref:hypothetical protein n=1 Tax=Sphingomonas sp. TaxID=28214 RepID=UPI00286DCAB7|nr:hypothetical protein [Sphingomonas sp.]